MTTMTTTEARPAARRRIVFHPLRVADINRLTDEAIAITFDIPEELRPDYQFTQGQHVALISDEVGDDVRRNYSICCSPNSGILRVAVKRLPGGAFSTWAHTKLKPGDTLRVLPPTGRFFTPLDPIAAKGYAAIAAGSGITPMMAIITATLEVEPQSTFTLIYGNRNTDSIMFLEELADLKNAYPDRFRVFHVLSREPQEVELFSGRIDGEKMRQFLTTIVPAESIDEWFLCGPSTMTEEVREALLDHGVAPSHIHRELFHSEATLPRTAPPREAPKVDEKVAGTSTVNATLEGRTSVLQVSPYGDSILDAFLKVRADAPYACKGGVCGTCRAKVIEGRVEMDLNYALEPEEQEAGVVLTCQAHPRTDLVTVDYDAV
jgi:ring-1,2-phenylacetyl-CoA epoxidase subunit PaaE